MATAVLSMKKPAKSAKAMNETLLRTKTIQRTANLLKQVSDSTRLQVISLLSEGERHVGGLCEEFNLSQPALSHHLALLRHGGIVDRHRQGKNNFYSLTDTGYRLSDRKRRRSLTCPDSQNQATRRIQRRSSDDSFQNEIRSAGAQHSATRNIKKSKSLPVKRKKFHDYSFLFIFRFVILR
jgi:DNA-binding transcriptional ArsR family regulator